MTKDFYKTYFEEELNNGRISLTHRTKVIKVSSYFRLLSITKKLRSDGVKLITDADEDGLTTFVDPLGNKVEIIRENG